MFIFHPRQPKLFNHLYFLWKPRAHSRLLDSVFVSANFASSNPFLLLSSPVLQAKYTPIHSHTHTESEQALCHLLFIAICGLNCGLAKQIISIYSASFRSIRVSSSLGSSVGCLRAGASSKNECRIQITLQCRRKDRGRA